MQLKRNRANENESKGRRIIVAKIQAWKLHKEEQITETS
jgi:hypothetical protein